MRVRIGDGELTFDGDTRQLVRGDEVVPLSPKAFELLETLLRGRPRALSHEELRDRLWPGVFVSYTALPRLVSELRRALADDHRAPRFLRSVHGFGYAFSGTAIDVEGAAAARAPAPVCELLWGERAIPLLEGDNPIGRSPECVVRLASSKVSRHHARVRVEGEGATLEDLGSHNGTWLRGRRLEEPAELAEGDEIGIGDAVLIFRRVGALTSTETLGGPARGGG